MSERYEYLLDTRWGCGLIVTDDEGTVIDSVPIFKKFRGLDIEDLPYCTGDKLTPVKIET